MADVLFSRVVIIRKMCKCSGCLKNIKRGSKVFTQKIADNGTIYIWRLCYSCRRFINQHDEIDFYDNGDGMLEGTMREFRQEEINHRRYITDSVKKFI